MTQITFSIYMSRSYRLYENEWYRSLINVNTLFPLSQLHARYQPRYLENTVQRSWELSIDTLQYGTITPLKRDTSSEFPTWSSTSLVTLVTGGRVSSATHEQTSIFSFLERTVGHIERICSHSASQGYVPFYPVTSNATLPRLRAVRHRTYATSPRRS